ncbi:MAG: MerR family transcriptional regulator [Anaerolineae bacterium]|nr:MerR family transcriptional regulator [Anaerolineae bacterium]
MQADLTELTIQEVAENTGLTAHTLRYYERIGLIFPINRAESGHRRYCSRDLDWIRFLTCLRKTGMPVREMKRFAELVEQGDSTITQRRALLETHRRRILNTIRELQANLSAVEWKINYYSDLEAEYRIADD